GFLWSFPCYIIISQYAENPQSKQAVIDQNLQFIVGERTPGGEQCILIFTDSDLAQRHRRSCPQAQSLGLLEIESPSQLRQLLEMARRNYRCVAVDVNRETGHVHGFSITDVIDNLTRPNSRPDPNDRG